jgi:hypothetical protein
VDDTTNTTRWPDLLRLAAAVVMVIAFFLPVSSCSNQLSVDQGYAGTQATEVAENSDISYRYPYESVTFGESASLLITVAYFWPIIAVCYRRKRPRRAGTKFAILELLLCLLSYWAVWGQTFLEAPEFGAYIAYCATTLYGLAVTVNLSEVFKIWRSRKDAISQS